MADDRKIPRILSVNIRVCIGEKHERHSNNNPVGEYTTGENPEASLGWLLQELGRSHTISHGKACFRRELALRHGGQMPKIGMKA